MSGYQFWKPNTDYVQGGMLDGLYASGAFTMVAAGPPRLANIGGQAAFKASLAQGGNADSIVFPIGIIQNLSVSHSRNFNRLYELGSERSYFVSGRTFGQISLGKAYYHASSILRALYAYYEDLLPPTLIPSVLPSDGGKSMPNKHNVIVPPGYENVWMNLASDLFAQPIGLMIYLRDVNEQTLASVYAECCVIPNHTWAVDAQGVMIQEQVALQFERLVPVATADVQLITSAANEGTGADLTFNQAALGSPTDGGKVKMVL